MYKGLGIYGGTFDPIHMGHLMVAEMARQDCDLEKVLFIPAGNPPHKSDKYISESVHRFEMTKLAVETNPYFEVSDIELKRQGKSYTIDTLRALRELYPKEYKFWVIIGGDSLLEIETWKNANEIMKMCNFAVYMRHNSSLDRCKAQAVAIHRKAKTNVLFVQAPMIEISSTDIRSRVAQRKSIRYMVPDTIGEYIIDKGLFARS